MSKCVATSMRVKKKKKKKNEATLHRGYFLL